MRSGEGLTSFNKDNSTNFLVKKSAVKLSQVSSVYSLRIREKTYS